MNKMPIYVNLSKREVDSGKIAFGWVISMLKLRTRKEQDRD